tara:strand:- start:995 stop:1102 length:108 start_codon:yes stop_codon:yes gene_type:complete
MTKAKIKIKEENVSIENKNLLFICLAIFISEIKSK